VAHDILHHNLRPLPMVLAVLQQRQKHFLQKNYIAIAVLG
jgi:hypothetical protein